MKDFISAATFFIKKRFWKSKYRNCLINEFTRILDSVPGSVYWKDKEGHYLGCNRHGLRDVKLSDPSEIIGLTDYDLFSSSTADQFRRHDLEVIRTEEMIDYEEVRELENGRLQAQYSYKKPLYDAHGNVIGIIGNTVDISTLKETQRDLKAALCASEKAQRVKAEFLENMAHDMRTPLAGILGIVSQLKKEVRDNHGLSESLGSLEQSAQNLSLLLDELIQQAKTNSVRRELQPRVFKLSELIDSLIRLFRPTLEYKKLNFECYFSEEIPDFVVGDATRLQHVLLDIFANAVKFTEKGSVYLKVETTNTDMHCIRFIVQDTGIGIPQDKLDEIFEAFVRLSPAHVGRYQGVGLGLTRARQLLQDLKGAIQVESQLGKGSRFVIDVPFTQSSSTAVDQFDRSQTKDIDLKKAFDRIESTLFSKSLTHFSSKASENTRLNKVQSHTRKSHVLIVEDVELIQRVMKSMFESLGCVVDVAADACEAIVAHQRCHYELILMDIGLGVISGSEATKIIRALELSVGYYTPIVGLTAHVDASEEAIHLENGMDAVLTKPLNEDTARKLLAFLRSKK